MYNIVVFSNGTCEMVPKLWMTDVNICLWPPLTIRSFEVAHFIKKIKDPESDWVQLSVTILGEAKTYAEARKKLIKAQSLSELSTTDPEDCGRGKRRKVAKKFESPQTSASDSEGEREMSQSLLQKLPPAPLPAELDVEEANSLTFSSVPPLRNISNVTTSAMSSPQSLSMTPKATVCISQSLAGSSQAEISIENSGNLKIYDMLKSILREQKLIRHTQAQILERLDLNSEKISTADENLITFAFPCKLEKDLLEVNELMIKVEYRNELVSKLHKIGGNDFKDHTRRILRFVMNDEVAGLYSWVGSKDKKRFSSLAISDIIIDAVVQNKSVSRSQVEEVIKTWLRHAKERRLYINKNSH